MMNSDTRYDLITAAVLVVIVIAMVVVVVFAVTYKSPHVDYEAKELAFNKQSLGSYLDFPEGYELADSYAYGSYSPFVVYICRHVETGEYRTCNPVVREAGE